MCSFTSILRLENFLLPSQSSRLRFYTDVGNTTEQKQHNSGPYADTENYLHSTVHRTLQYLAEIERNSSSDLDALRKFPSSNTLRA